MDSKRQMAGTASAPVAAEGQTPGLAHGALAPRRRPNASARREQRWSLVYRFQVAGVGWFHVLTRDGEFLHTGPHAY